MKSVLVVLIFVLFVLQASTHYDEHRNLKQDSDSDSGSGNDSGSGSDSDSGSDSSTKKCQTRQVLVNGVCVNVIDQCKTWNKKTGVCQSCNKGYTLSAGKCNSVCQTRQVFIGGKCINVVEQCNTWSNTTGDCLTCNNGYVLQAKKCVITCQSRQVLVNGSCVNVNVRCKTWSNTTALCTSCTTGYSLSNGQCNSICSARQVYVNGACVSVSPLCQDWSNTTALCTSCTTGYTYSNGICLNCSYGFYASEGECKSMCPFRQVYIGGVCVPVSEFCLTWSNTTGLCTTCIPKYDLFQGQCWNSRTVGPCKTKNSQGKCLSCHPNAVLIPDEGICCISGC